MKLPQINLIQIETVLPPKISQYDPLRVYLSTKRTRGYEAQYFIELSNFCWRLSIDYRFVVTKIVL